MRERGGKRWWLRRMLREMGRMDGGWIEGGERGCGRASWVDLGFGCRKMGREGKGREGTFDAGWMGLSRCPGSGRETE